jgi:NAD(P)-dependent dehydrogenase (short-subunit alcohol dehydrogenase family)
VSDPDRRSTLSNKAAVITGAAHGPGREHARTLSEHGASVALIDIAEDAVFALAAELPGALAIRTDVTDGAQVTDMVSEVVASFGAIDIVVNKAGGARGYTDAGSAEQEWRATLELNLTSAWLVTQAVVPFMKQRGGSRIVNTTSNTAMRPPGDVSVSYIAAKAGVIGLTRALAKELGPSNITVNTIAPGFTPHDDLRRKLPAERLNAMTAATISEQCLPRRGSASDMAAAVLFLVGPGGEFVTGQVLAIDGGWTFN